jgi:uncharacterized protein
MVIDLRSILHGTREFNFLMDRDWWRENGLNDSVIGLASPLKVRVGISNSGNKYFLDGHLSGEVTVRCDRCLEHYGYKLDTGFLVALVVRQSESGQVEVELFQEDLAVELIDGFVIDLNEIAREQVFLALPMKNLCRDDCAGLCRLCGSNLNRGTCRCMAKTGHPGFSKLKHLKIKGA